MTQPEPTRDHVRHRAVRLPALGAVDRRPGRHADDAGHARGRPPRRLRAEAEQLRPRPSTSSCTTSSSGCASSTPRCKAVVVTGGLDKVFCAGANIQMLAGSTHAHKVNFCKFTNETRNSIEDATAHSGQTWIAAVNGTAAGGGYELALACDEIVLVDDRAIGRVAARGAAARRAARHRRSDPRRRQAPRPPRPRRRLRHPRRGRQGPAGARVGPRRRHRPAQPLRRRSCPSGRRPGPPTTRPTDADRVC